MGRPDLALLDKAPHNHKWQDRFSSWLKDTTVLFDNAALVNRNTDAFTGGSFHIKETAGGC